MSVQLEIGADTGLFAKAREAFSLRRNLRTLFVRPAEHVALFDGLRCLAILLTVLYHSFAIYGAVRPGINPDAVYQELGHGFSWLLNCEFGVDVFFTTSGFLISAILFRQIDKRGKIDIGQFYIRRYLRLTPVYYFALLIYWLVHGKNYENILANVFYVNNLLDYKNQAMTWSWSLAVEEQFYLIYPLFLGLLMAKSRSPLTWMWGLFAMAFVIRLGVIVSDPILLNTPLRHLLTDPEYRAHNMTVIYDDFHTRYGALLIGCIAAYYSYFRGEKIKAFFASAYGQCAGWSGVVLVGAVLWFPIMDPAFDNARTLQVVFGVIKHNMVGCGVALIILASSSTTLFARIVRLTLGNRLWYPLAQLTYSTYIFHFMVIVVVAPTIANIVAKQPQVLSGSLLQMGWLVTAVSWSITVFISLLAYLFIERPFMNLRK